MTWAIEFRLLSPLRKIARSHSIDFEFLFLLLIFYDLGTFGESPFKPRGVASFQTVKPLHQSLPVLKSHIPADTHFQWQCEYVCVCGSEWMERLRDSSQQRARHPGNLILFMNYKTSIVKKRERKKKKKKSALTHVLPASLPDCTAPLYIYYRISLCVCCLAEGRWWHCPAIKAESFYQAGMQRCSH